MREVLIIIGILFMGRALRSIRRKSTRKLGMLCYISASALIPYFLTGSIVAAVVTLLAWILFPWVELYFSVRKTELPLHNKLSQQQIPCQSHFPQARAMGQHFLDLGYQHLSDCGWNWDKSKEHYSLFWHEKKKHLVSICHRIQPCVTFCYLNISSITDDGTLFRSSNFPFSSSLPPAPDTQFNHITNGDFSCPDYVIYAHELFIYNAGSDLDKLADTDVEKIESTLEEQTRHQLDHNLKSGLIRINDRDTFSYTFKGLFYLWKQILKDMIRLC